MNEIKLENHNYFSTKISKIELSLLNSLVSSVIEVLKNPDKYSWTN